MSSSPPAKKSRQSRASFTVAQISAMETIFLQTQYPDPLVLEGLSERTMIPLHKLCTWFQNRRARFRKESKKNHITWMRGQLFETGTPVQPEERDVTIASCHVLSAAAPPTPPEQRIHESPSWKTESGFRAEQTANHVRDDVLVQNNNFRYSVPPVTSYQTHDQLPVQMSQYPVQDTCSAMNVLHTSSSVYSYSNVQTTNHYSNFYDIHDNNQELAYGKDFASWAY